MVIRIIILLLMFAANASAQNWKEISKAVAIEHKKLLGEAEKFIANSTVDYYRKLRNRTHFYNIESFHVNHNDTLIMIELYPSSGYGRGTIWKYCSNYQDVFARDYGNRLVEYYYHKGKLRAMRDYEQMYYDYDFRKMCNDWDFLEYEKKRKKLLYGGAEVWSVRIITKIIIDGTKYRIFTHELK